MSEQSATNDPIHNPYAAPTAAMSEPTTDFVLASRDRRFVAKTVDVLIVMLIGLALSQITEIFFHISLISLEEKFSVKQNPLLILTDFLVGQVIFLALNGYLLFTNGQTLGKAMMGIRIVKLNGHIPSIWCSWVVRHMLVGQIIQIPYVGLGVSLIGGLMIFGKSRRCLHDYLAGTIVIEAR